MRMTCTTCIRKAMCSFSFLAVNNRHLKCNHYQLEQNIIDRKFSYFGSEYLSRPRTIKSSASSQGSNSDDIVKENYEEYFNSLSVIAHNYLLKEIIYKIDKSINDGYTLPNNLFINVEKFSLLDGYIVDKLVSLTNKYRKTGNMLIIEVTERHEYLDHLLLQVLPEINDRGLNLALDDFEFRHIKSPMLKYFDYIKIEIEELYRHEHVTDYLYILVEQKKKIIAERIENRTQLDFALSLPIHYFQGFFIE
ncbi:EAL domain-containing protein [Vibrio parahaemolyticus]